MSRCISADALPRRRTSSLPVMPSATSARQASNSRFRLLSTRTLPRSKCAQSLGYLVAACAGRLGSPYRLASRLPGGKNCLVPIARQRLPAWSLYKLARHTSLSPAASWRPDISGESAGAPRSRGLHRPTQANGSDLIGGSGTVDQRRGYDLRKLTKTASRGTNGTVQGRA
jgi:hypothetical protein